MAKKPQTKKSAPAKRLRAGELDALVLAYMGKHKEDGPLTATERTTERLAQASS